MDPSRRAERQKIQEKSNRVYRLHLQTNRAAKLRPAKSPDRPGQLQTKLNAPNLQKQSRVPTAGRRNNRSEQFELFHEKIANGSTEQRLLCHNLPFQYDKRG